MANPESVAVFGPPASDPEQGNTRNIASDTGNTPRMVPVTGNILDEATYVIRVTLQRFVRKLRGRTALSDDEVKTLSRYIRWCTRQGRDVKPFIEKWELSRAFRHVLRGSQILPEFILPQITMLLFAWSRDEYNLAPQGVSALSDLSDETDDEHSEDAAVDDVTAPSARSTAMRGIIIRQGRRGTRVYSLDKAFQRPANVFGHNGLTVGAWWPFQICALRDGAHGSNNGGIYGKQDIGAYSIVVSSDDHDDRDLGDTVWYTGSGAQNSDQPLTSNNLALIASFNRHLPVRVIRSSKSHSMYAPSSGLRYDGLYRISWYGQTPGPSGFQVWKFKLERQLNQDPIRRQVPTSEDLNTL